MTPSDFAAMTAESGALALVLPWLVSVANQPHWPAWTRGLTSLAMCVLGGTFIAAVNGALDHPGSWSAAVLAVFAATQTVYHGWYKTRSGDLAGVLEAATSRKPAAIGSTPTPVGLPPVATDPLP